MSRDTKFGLPTGLTLADDGAPLPDGRFQREIYIFNTSGQQLGVYGEWGRDDGQFYYPAGITYIGNETFAVADKLNDRVQVIRIPSPIVPTYARAARYVPWFLGLGLLPLLALVRVRRRKLVFLADEAFLDSAIKAGNLKSLVDSTGRHICQ